MVKYAYLFVEDLWLYNYDQVRHEGVLELVFNVTFMIESMKFVILDRVFGLLSSQERMGISDYRGFTRERFLEIENSSTVLLEAMFSFFTYTLPINIITSLLCYFLFLEIMRFKISQFIRKFYFLKTTLLQTTLEGSMSYFAYVCFGHLSMAFSFVFVDKAALTFTVVFLWGLLMFSLTFYLLVGYFLRQKAYHFIYCMYRVHEGYIFITVKALLRNFVRGAIFYFLCDRYEL